jgi:hypothetical protein
MTRQPVVAPEFAFAETDAATRREGAPIAKAKREFTSLTILEHDP